GTTYGGGTNGEGTLFAINTVGPVFTVLHTFTGTANNNDGANPEAGLILSGNTLYGTTYGGGSNELGTVFAINTNGLDYTILYNLNGGSDGAYPYAGLVLAGNTLFGATTYAGSGS